MNAPDSSSTLPVPALPDGLVVVVKRDCPTCLLVVPALAELRAAGRSLTVVTQDDPTFPEDLDPVDDRELSISWTLGTEAVPTLYRVADGRVEDQTVGWNRDAWRAFTGLPDLGTELPEYRPGCGSLTVEPARELELRRRFEGSRLRSREVELGSEEDAIEACFARGWSDGLPVVPPTPERVERMLGGTKRDPQEVVTLLAPDLAECTIEKIAINAVMAGCLPEYLPVVIAAVEAIASDEFNIHGLAATTMPVGPVIVVNGPIRERIGMNWGKNAMGQGNRANATIGRALQLVVRNVGGARPGDVDRATLGQPGKYTFCFAEDEADSPWESLAIERGVEPGRSAVTVFGGDAPHVVVDQLSRDPESLSRSLAASLRSVIHTKLVMGFDAMVVIAPEHARVFREAGWSKQRLREELMKLLMIPKSELVRGAGGIAEGVPATVEAEMLPKFLPDGLWFVHAGGKAGLFSAIIGGWVRGQMGTLPATRVIEE